MASFLQLKNYRRGKKRVYFTKNELAQLLQTYSQNVTNGHWRDYAIDHNIGMALFSVFRSSHEIPLYVFTKFPETSTQPAEFAVFTPQKKLIQDQNLSIVLQKINMRPQLIASDKRNFFCPI